MTASLQPKPRRAADPVPPRPALDTGVDLHVATTHSYGRGALLAAAVRATTGGLRELGVADHVAPDPGWFADYVGAVRAADAVCGIRVRCGLEVGLLDGSGRLDLPAAVRTRLSAVDYVVLVPTRAAVWRRGGDATAEQVLEDVLLASLRAAATLPVPVVLTAPTGMLPELGLDERDVPDATVGELGWALARAGVAVEVSERLRSPSPRFARLLATAGVGLVAGSGARTVAEIGRWDHVATVAAALRGEDGTAPGAHRAAGPPDRRR